MNLKPGDCVFRLEPYAVAALDSERLTRCDHCLEESEKKCSVCKAVSYCSRECQKEAWSRYHRIECRCLVNHAPYVPSMMQRLFLKVLARHLGDDPDGSVWRDSAGLRTFYDLAGHESEIRADQLRMLAFSRFVDSLQVFTRGVLGANQIPSRDVLLAIFGRMEKNSTLLKDSLCHILGKGIYLSLSVRHHSCIPTADMYFQSGRLVVKCLASVDSVDSLTFCFCDPMLPWGLRNAVLFYPANVTCKCQLCLEALNCGGEPDDLKCSRGGCQGVCRFCEKDVGADGRISGTCVCDRCGSPPITRSPDLVRTWRSRCTQAASSEREIYMPPPALARDLLGHPQNPLHPQHRVCFTLCGSVFKDCIDRNNDSEALRIGESVLLPALARHLRLSPWQLKMGQVRYHLGHLAFDLGEMTRALGHLVRAEAVFSVSMEPDAPAFVRVRELLAQARSALGQGSQCGS